MALEISGKVIQVLPEQSGSGKNGAWVKQDFIVETQEQFPKKVCFAAWGDKAAVAKKMTTGTTIKVSFNVESREFNGKWYTDLKVWKLDVAELQSNSGSETPPPPPDDTYFADSESDTILPF